jgi:hypothetical protein
LLGSAGKGRAYVECMGIRNIRVIRVIRVTKARAAVLIMRV